MTRLINSQTYYDEFEWHENNRRSNEDGCFCSILHDVMHGAIFP